ncbi:hypothetical protein [Polaribacter sp. L3A8]|uniref:hypothetical protein n=1 Tax=Polaribacter sp. L3A8 TaxID=2686361 RepID=UPI00131B7359|nr:hypothetical protein [Polaribacter sp. L3A8]
MKTILISDVGGKQETIIPYALNLTKHIDNKIEIVHVVDSRVQQGVSSAYSDSQSFQVGEKLSTTMIIEREVSLVKSRLDKLLSVEASKLNFPLKVYTIVEENSIENLLQTIFKVDEPSIIISSSALEGTILNDIDESLELAKIFNNLSLIITPGSKFTIPKKILIQYDFELEINDGVFRVLDYLKPLNIPIDVVGVTEIDKYPEMVIKSEAWQQDASNYMNSSLPITTNILTGNQQAEVLSSFIQTNNYDLVAIPKDMKTSPSINVFSKDLSKQLLESLDIPVIIY